MDYRTQEFYWAIVSGEIEQLCTASADAPKGVNVEDVDRKGPHWDKEAGEPAFIPVPVLNPNDKKYLDPLELDALLGSVTSDKAREWEYKKAVSIWQSYRDNSDSRKLDRVLKRVLICLSDLAEKYGFTASLPALTTDGSAQDPAGQTTPDTDGSAQKPTGKTATDPQSHGVPEGLPDELKNDKAYKLFYALESKEYVNDKWQPGPKLYHGQNESGRAGSIHQGLASYVALQFKSCIKGELYTPVFNSFWETSLNGSKLSRAGASQKAGHKKEIGSPKAEIDEIISKLNQ